MSVSYFDLDDALRAKKPVKTIVWYLKRIKDLDDDGYLEDSLAIVESALEAIATNSYTTDLLHVLFENRVKPWVDFVGVSRFIYRQDIALKVIKTLIDHGVDIEGDPWVPFSAYICKWRFDYSTAWATRPKGYKGSQLDYLSEKQKEFDQSVVDALQYLKDHGANLNWHNKVEDETLPKIAKANLNVAAYRFLKDNGCTSYDFSIDTKLLKDTRPEELDCIVFRGKKYFLGKATIWPSYLVDKFDFQEGVYQTVKHLVSIRHSETNEPILFENLFHGDELYIKLSDGRVASCRSKVPMNYFDIIPLFPFEPFFPFTGVDEFFFSESVTSVFDSYYETSDS